MKNLKRVIALSMAGCMMAGAMAACNTEGGDTSSKAAVGESSVDTKDVKSIYFLNFKPEIADKYAAIAEQYKKETGIEVKVTTAASGEYEQTLTAEMAKSEPPTIFQINGPVGYSNWAEWCADLKSTDLYNILSDKSLAVTKDDGVYGIPYAVEGYGIIYNDAIMQKYFATSGAKVTSVDEINSFDKLSAVVEDMTAKKADLGIDGVFGSTSLKTGDDWRWQTHLMDLPLYYEFKTDSGSSITSCLNSTELKFTYADNYKKIFDLYTNNSCTEKSLLGGKTVDESMAEFATGKCAMIQNGNWAWGQINGIDGNQVKAEDVKFLPIYTGVDGEEKQGLCIGTENYFAINSKVDAATQKASADFLNWLFTSEYGKKAVKDDLGFIAPFTSFGDNEKPEDPLAKSVLSWMEKDGYKSVEWTFGGIPSENWKKEFGANLLQYVQGQKEWNAVVDEAKSSWTTEREAAATA